jgi:hypothetical protein
MNNNENLKLIQGQFSPEDAKEILTHIFSTKINFHQMKNFSSKEMLGLDDPIAMERIPALRKEMGKLEKLIQAAEASKQKINISADVVISLTNE